MSLSEHFPVILDEQASHFAPASEVFFSSSQCASVKTVAIIPACLCKPHDLSRPFRIRFNQGERKIRHIANVIKHHATHPLKKRKFCRNSQNILDVSAWNISPDKTKIRLAVSNVKLLTKYVIFIMACFFSRHGQLPVSWIIITIDCNCDYL